MFNQPEPKTAADKEDVVRGAMGLKSKPKAPKGPPEIRIKHSGSKYKVTHHNSSGDQVGASEHDHMNHAFAQAMQTMAGSNEPDKDGD